MKISSGATSRYAVSTSTWGYTPIARISRWRCGCCATSAFAHRATAEQRLTQRVIFRQLKQRPTQQAIDAAVADVS